MEPKPMAAFILALVAGVLILLGGVLELWVAAALFGSGFVFPNNDWLVAFGVVGVSLGIFVVAFSVLLYFHPQHHVVFGVLILVLSLLSVLDYGGFLVGLVLGIVGGILAITWTPYRWTPPFYGPMSPAGWPYVPPPYSAASHRACLKCGRFIGLDSKFCPQCGNAVAD